MISGEFRKEDYWSIRWPLLSLVLSLVISAGLLLGLNTLDTSATAELRRARAQLDDARDSVDQIEEEEATIIEYLGRYREMEQEAVMAPEDRLQFQETLAQLRSQYSLFPVRLGFGQQSALPLEYSEGRSDRGRQILLQTSPVEITLPLLHEDDLARLLGSLLDGHGLLQPLTCSMTANTTRTTSFIYLSQHFDARCSLNWYTFRLPPPEGSAR